jgi:hypothetical protein
VPHKTRLTKRRQRKKKKKKTEREKSKRIHLSDESAFIETVLPEEATRTSIPGLEFLICVIMRKGFFDLFVVGGGPTGD